MIAPNDTEAFVATSWPIEKVGFAPSPPTLTIVTPVPAVTFAT